MSSSIKVSRTNSSPSKRIVWISTRVRLRTVEIIEPEMSLHFLPCGLYCPSLVTMDYCGEHVCSGELRTGTGASGAKFVQHLE